MNTETNYTITMTEQDWHITAVNAWQNANRNLKQFAEACANVSNHKTAALAADCGCSVDTVERYRNAWKLYQELERENFRTVRKLWEDGNIALWRKAPELRARLGLSLEKTYDYLQTGIENGMSRETFSAHIDEKENTTPKWLRVLQRVTDLLRRDDWMVEMPIEKRERYEQARERFTAELEEIGRE